jgi:hypothetical protein
MRYVTDQELKELDDTGKRTWKPMTIHSYSSEAGGGYFTMPKLEDVTHLMMQCLRCKSHYLLESCPNCGFTEYTPTSSGIFCARCERGFRNWTCSQCNTENPATKTLFGLEKQGGCFIATAVYGSYDAPEVRSLRLLRDNILEATSVGRQLVRTYYLCSPPIAAVLRRHPLLRRFVRSALVEPLVRFARWTAEGK